MSNAFTMDLGLSERAASLLEAVRAMIRDEIRPAEAEFFTEIERGDRWTLRDRQLELLEGLKEKARARGLWNFFLTEGEHASGLSTVDYAYLAEAMGASPLAAEVFNCSAPDSGNMEVLARYGTAEQQDRWLAPLLAGEIRSAYAMTEPEVASSDATNLRLKATRHDNGWLLDGEKTWVSGAGDPRCKVLIVMALTNPGAARHQRHSQFLVPMHADGLEVLRPMRVLGEDDAPHGHMHLRFDSVHVPREDLLLGEGRGFEIAQGRLGPGRIHHCMRAIGMAEHALSLACGRALSREAFGRPLAKLGGTTARLGEARIAVDQARLLTLRTAWAMDHEDAASARSWISKAKAEVPRVALEVIDQAIQLHGAAGLSQDFPLAELFRWARALRLADGPDEVHATVVGRAELERHREHGG